MMVVVVVFLGGGLLALIQVRMPRCVCMRSSYHCLRPINLNHSPFPPNFVFSLQSWSFAEGLYYFVNVYTMSGMVGRRITLGSGTAA